MQVIKTFGGILGACLALTIPATIKAAHLENVGQRCVVMINDRLNEVYERQVSPITSRIHGSVELIPGFPATPTNLNGPGRIGIVNSPRGALLREDAQFELLGENAFEGCLRMQAEVVVAGTNERIVREFSACMTGQFDQDEENCYLSNISIDVPPVVMSRPSTITGSFPGVSATVANDVYVAIDSLGIAVPISASGTFIIPGVPPGLHRIDLRPFNANTTTIRGTAWMNAPVWAGLQSNHVGPTVAVTRLAISPSTATSTTSTTTSSTTSTTTSNPIVSK